MHGGGIELVDVSPEGEVRVRFLGMCTPCPLLQPKRWGGGEVYIVEFTDAIIELSRANPSAGWVAGVIGRAPVAAGAV
jgi:hypothetical protein